MLAALEAVLSILPALPPPEPPRPPPPPCPPPPAPVGIVPPPLPLKLLKSGIFHSFLGTGLLFAPSSELSPPTLFKAALVSKILEIKLDSQLIALLTKLEIVASPLDAQAGKTLSAIPLKAEATASNAEPTPLTIHSKALHIPSSTFETISKR